MSYHNHDPQDPNGRKFAKATPPIDGTKGTMVNRSTYQKIAEENKKLIKDIMILCLDPHTVEAVELRSKWRTKFMEEKERDELIREVCLQYLKDHPEYDIKNWKS